jgi:glucosyl-3-phosphoglycerate phosphatase
MTAKTILCIRHGESTFNRAWRATPVDPLHFDAPLSETGYEQVRQARPALADVPVEIVIVSPLTRALQTALGLFGEHPSAPPMLVAHLARERVENSCDVGRSPALLAAEFPSVDVAHLDDVWWHAEGEADERGICVEPLEAVDARVAEFRSFLLGRPERVIAVVAHGTFFFHLTGRQLANCEVATIELE